MSYRMPSRKQMSVDDAGLERRKRRPRDPSPDRPESKTGIDLEPVSDKHVTEHPPKRH